MTTFIVNDNQPTQYPTVTASYGLKGIVENSSVVLGNNGRILKYSDSENVVDGFGNGFIGAVMEAYCNHHHLILRPDDVWFAITSAFGRFFNSDSFKSESRLKFCRPNKVLEMEGPVSDCIEDGAKVIEKLTESITSTQLKDWIIPNFSTTTDRDKLVGSTVLAESMTDPKQKEWLFICGLYKVTLLGTLNDWQDIRRRVDGLLIYGDMHEDVRKWYLTLAPILDKFVDSHQGDVDVEFWKRICFTESYCGRSKLSGWIVAFFPFDGEEYALQDPDGIAQKGVYGYLPIPGIPDAVVQVPVTVKENGNTRNLILCAGPIVFTHEHARREICTRLDYAWIRTPYSVLKQKSRLRG